MSKYDVSTGTIYLNYDDIKNLQEHKHIAIKLRLSEIQIRYEFHPDVEREEYELQKHRADLMQIKMDFESLCKRLEKAIREAQ